eukprot:366022-Chlamydomonas_euryale.AAC.9
MAFHLLCQHRCILHRMPHQEDAAEARAEGGLRLCHTDLGAGDLRGQMWVRRWVGGRLLD